MVAESADLRAQVAARPQAEMETEADEAGPQVAAEACVRPQLPTRHAPLRLACLLCQASPLPLIAWR